MSNISTTLSRLGEIDLDRAELNWQRLVSSVGQIGASIGPISQTVALLSSKGKLTPEVAKAYIAWYQTANNVLSALANLIEQNPDLRDAIDAAGSVGNALDGLASMLQGVSRPSTVVVELLRGPLPAVGPKSLNGLDGAAELTANLARFASPAWKKLMELLSNRGVIIVGSTAVAANKVSEILGSNSQLEDQRADLYTKLYSSLTKAGVDPDEAHRRALQIVNETKTGVDAPLLWLGGGAIGLGLLLFWMKRQGVTVVVPERGGKS